MKAYIVKKNVLVHDSPPHPGMDLNGAHKEDSTVASSGSRCRTMCMNNRHLLFQLVSFLWSTPLNIVYLVLIDIIFFKLTNHKNRIKASAFIHHIVLAP